MESVITRTMQSRWDSKLRGIKTSLTDQESYLIDENSVTEFETYLEHNKVKEIPPFKKVYFSKNATISRVKFRDWARYKNIKVVLDSRKADIVVIEEFDIGQLTNHAAMLTYTTEEVMDIDDNGKYSK